MFYIHQAALTRGPQRNPWHRRHSPHVLPSGELSQRGPGCGGNNCSAFYEPQKLTKDMQNSFDLRDSLLHIKRILKWLPSGMMLKILKRFSYLLTSDMMASSLKSKLLFIHPMFWSTQASSDQIISKCQTSSNCLVISSICHAVADRIHFQHIMLRCT